MLYLIVLVVCVHSIRKKVPVFDDDDVFVGMSNFEGKIIPRHENFTFPQDTPVLISAEAEKKFSDAYMESLDFDEWIRIGEFCDEKAIIYHFMNDRIPEPFQNPCLLSEYTSYTWTLTDDLQLTFGKYVNILEWGSKHINLAGGRKVINAGEIYVHRRMVHWNVDSGSFTEEYIKKFGDEYKDYLVDGMTKVWKQIVPTEMCKDRDNFDFKFDDKILLNVTLSPSYDYMDNICVNGYPESNSWFLWKDGAVPVCEHLDCLKSISIEKV